MTDKLVSPIVQPPGAIVVSEGMTMRDYFASQALQALILRGPQSPGQTATEFITEAGIVAYMHADALLAAGAEPEAE